MEFNYVANNTFAKVHQDPNKYIFVRGPVGSGKSSGCIWHILLNSFKQEPQYDGVRRSRYGIIRASYPALKSTVIKSWKLWMKDLVKIVYDIPIRGSIKIPHPDGVTTCDIELVFLALDREEDINKLQSAEWTGCHINEAAETPQGVHQMVKSRINRYPDMSDGGAVDPFILCDYNSVPTDHWLYRLAEEAKPPKHSFYSQPPALLMVGDGEGDIIDAAGNTYIINPDADNLGHPAYGDRNNPPTKNSVWDNVLQMWWVPHLDSDYYADQVYGADPDWVNVLILNNYGEVRSGKPVYPEYIDNIHYSESLTKPIEGVPIVIGMDLGLTPAACFTQLSPTGKLLIFDEIVTEDCSIQKFCEDLLLPHLRTHYPKRKFDLVIDPAAVNRSQNDAKAAAEIIKDAGLPYTLARTNNELKRREAVVYFLRKQEGMVVGPKVPYLRKGFISGYQFQKKRLAQIGSTLQNFKEKPEKNIYSHIHDGCQYACLEHTEGKTARRKKQRAKSHNQNRTPNRYDSPATSAGY